MRFQWRLGARKRDKVKGERREARGEETNKAALKNAALFINMYG